MILILSSSDRFLLIQICSYSFSCPPDYDLSTFELNPNFLFEIGIFFTQIVFLYESFFFFNFLVKKKTHSC